jgi:hypothetical protein
MSGDRDASLQHHALDRSGEAIISCCPDAKVGSDGMQRSRRHVCLHLIALGVYPLRIGINTI